MARFRLAMQGLGLVLIVGAFVALLYAGTFKWTPVRVPLDLQKDSIKTVAFTANMAATHEVVINFERKLPFEELSNLLNTLDEPESTSSNKLFHPRVYCTVSNRGKEVKYGDYSGQIWGRDVGAVVRTFPAIVGETYTVKTTIKAGSAYFQSTNPALVVAVERDPVLFGADGIYILEFVAKCVLVPGLIMLSAGVLIPRKV